MRPMQVGAAQCLQSIDHALFEKLGDAVVASSNRLYEAVLHTGINPEGKTVVGPVDGFCLVSSSSPPHFVLVQHTTTAKRDLRSKWLQGCEGLPSGSRRTVRRKIGDLKKASQLAQTLKGDFPAAEFTVVLTTNQSVDQKLYTEVQKIAAAFGLHADVWDQTRICRYLDTTPIGQWLRWRFLGIAAQQLSRPLLHDLSLQSRTRYCQTLAGREESWIRRDIEAQIEGLSGQSTRLLQFLVGDSGFGKSVLSARIFEARCANGELCFWLPAEYLESTPTLEEAFLRAVLLTAPELWPRASDQLIALASRESRVTLIVDDVNRTRDPAHCVRKLIAWLYPRTGKGDGQNGLPLQVLCPLWPALADQFSAHAETDVPWRQINVDVLNAAEVRAAIAKAASVAGRILSNLDLEMVVAFVGHDPYSIGLWAELLIADPAASLVDLAKNVQDKFFSQALARASAATARPIYVLAASLKAFAAQMLKQRDLQPTNASVEAWFVDRPDIKASLMALLHHGYIMRLGIDGRISFRHDRLRDELIRRGLRLALDSTPELLCEPFYAKYLGRGAAEGILNDNEVAALRTTNPVALCESFGWRAMEESQRDRVLTDTTLRWVREDVVTGLALPAVIWEASAALFRSSARRALDVTADMPRNHYVLLARLRQGDAVSGAMFCGRAKGVFYPGVRAIHFENTVAHALTHHRDTLLKSITDALASEEKLRSDANGLLLMAGYVASPTLLTSVVSAWRRTPDPTHSLPFAVWAALRCAGEEGYTHFQELLTFWKELSDDRDENGMSPFWNVGSWLRHSFRWIKTSDSVRWVLRAAKDDSAMTKVLATLINEIDAPDAVEFGARHAGSVRKSLSPKAVLPMWLETRHWDPRNDFGKRLTPESQDRLRMLWQSSTDNDDVRCVAFDTWSLGCDRSDLDALRAIGPTDVLFDRSVWTRANLADVEIVEDLAKLLRNQPHFWWVAHRVWDDRIRSVAEESLNDVVKTVSNDCAEYSDYRLENIVEAVVRLPPSEAEGLFQKFWPRLGKTRDFIIGALRIGTQCSRALAAQSIEVCSPDLSLFEHISMRIVTHRLGEVVDYAVEARALESLEPYVDRIWDDDFDALLRDFCRGKHRVWCRRVLFGRMSNQQKLFYFPSDDDLVAAFDSLLQRDVANKANFKHTHARFWWEELERREVRPARVWCSIRRSKKATAAANAEVVCQLVAQFGSRKELSLLHELIDKAGELEVIKRFSENAAFAVRSRVLI